MENKKKGEKKLEIPQTEEERQQDWLKNCDIQEAETEVLINIYKKYLENQFKCPDDHDMNIKIDFPKFKHKFLNLTTGKTEIRWIQRRDEKAYWKMVKESLCIAMHNTKLFGFGMTYTM